VAIPAAGIASGDRARTDGGESMITGGGGRRIVTGG
jgi:hypothetical protein